MLCEGSYPHKAYIYLGKVKDTATDSTLVWQSCSHVIHIGFEQAPDECQDRENLWAKVAQEALWA